MGIASVIRTSILGLLTADSNPSDSTMLDQAEAIRHAMLGVLGDDGPTDYPALVRRIKYTDDVNGLWFLRSELMGALASMYGENRGREVMEHLSHMFKGYVPDAKSSKRFNVGAR